MVAAYTPSACYPTHEVDREYLRHEDTPLLARVYLPEATGPFPMLVAVHGGAWQGGDRLEGALVHRALAASGVIVASLDFRLAPDHPYPAQVQDVHYGVRWLKAHAAELHGDSELVGMIGGSSGGNTALLSALRPHYARYGAIPLPEAHTVDAEVAFVICCWSVIDPWARFEFARTTPAAGGGFGGAEQKVRQTMDYFRTETLIHEGNPQEIVERGEAEARPPVLILQGTEDMNIPLTSPQRFAPAYRAAGGVVQVAWFPGEPHGFARQDSASTEQAIAIMKEFIASSVRVGAPT